MKRSLLLNAVLALVTLAPTLTVAAAEHEPLFALTAEEVVENHANGKVRLRYQTDADGRRHGLFEQFRESGQLEIRCRYADGALNGLHETFYEGGEPAVVASYLKGKKHGTWRELTVDGLPRLTATYRNDVLNGKYESFDEAGHCTLSANYKEGVLHGAMTQYFPERDRRWIGRYKNGVVDGAVSVKDGKKTVCKQKWKAGVLVRLNGEEPFARSLSQVRDGIETVLRRPEGTPEPGSGTDDDPKAGDRAAALRRLKAYRFLCGVPYEKLKLDPALNKLCDAAAEACALNGGLSHTPSKPPGMDDDRYRDAKRGARNSNLSGGPMISSVDSYMDDSDSSNISRVGHRRWCLDPALGKTAFGSFKNYSAMWAIDSSGSSAKGISALLYPPAGWVPTDMFGPNYAWSVSILRGAAPVEDRVEAKVFELDEHWVKKGEPLELNWQSVSRTEGQGAEIGGAPALIFRPVGVRVVPGAKYQAEVSLDGGKSIAHRYVVAFYDPDEQG